MINETERNTINSALGILKRELQVPDVYIKDPSTTKSYLQLRLAEREYEVFAAMFQDNQHGLIEYVELFRGTIDGANVYLREVAKEALSRNASPRLADKVGLNTKIGIKELARKLSNEIKGTGITGN